MITSSPGPLLLLDGDLTVIAASASFCIAFGLDRDRVEGRLVFILGRGEWQLPRLRSLLQATVTSGAQVDAYQLDLQRDDEVRRLVVSAHRLDFDDAGEVRLLVSVRDITDARAQDRQRDDLVREKAILLQEIQHRVANSLQIIASVLMQSARTTRSEESRGHLHAAHHRVMSVAAVQKQLAVSSLQAVALRPYLTQLCASIGASMIHDHRQLSIAVDVDHSDVAPNVSVSLGLIVTELVINALKHAFPGHRPGCITVRYRGGGGDAWSLAVDDDGVGMPEGVHTATAGLGTTIVQALAKQLGATVRLAVRSPGTSVSVSQKAQCLPRGANDPAIAAA